MQVVQSLSAWGTQLIKYRHLKKGILFGLSVGIAVALSSARYNGSVPRGLFTGLVVALMGTLIQGWFEANAERKRKIKGITLSDVPLRPRVILNLSANPDVVMSLCREA